MLLAITAPPVLADAPSVAGTAPSSDAMEASPAEPTHFLYLDPAEFDPDRLVPAPPARGSQIEAFELARLHMLIGSASKERLEQAKWDGDREDPSIFNTAIGRDLSKLPKTWALLTAVQNETDYAIGLGKAHFARIRPWGLDASINMCGANTRKNPARSYPSGHAGLGWSVGFILAQLVPAKAPAVLARADDYAISRELCGTHFRSDTEASHAIGTLIASRLLADRRLAPQIAAARAELSQP
jgi:acid phosphatase (class A)